MPGGRLAQLIVPAQAGLEVAGSILPGGHPVFPVVCHPLHCQCPHAIISMHAPTSPGWWGNMGKAHTAFRAGFTQLSLCSPFLSTCIVLRVLWHVYYKITHISCFHVSVSQLCPCITIQGHEILHATTVMSQGYSIRFSASWHKRNSCFPPFSPDFLQSNIFYNSSLQKEAG